MTNKSVYDIIVRTLGNGHKEHLPQDAAALQRFYNESEVLFVFAIIETGGKQYKVNEGDIIFVEKLEVNEGDTVTFDCVKALSAENGFVVGTPVVEGAKVTAKVLKNGKSKKVIVYKMHPKKGYRRKQGHRQPYTKVQIEKING